MKQYSWSTWHIAKQYSWSTWHIANLALISSIVPPYTVLHPMCSHGWLKDASWHIQMSIAGKETKLVIYILLRHMEVFMNHFISKLHSSTLILIGNKII
jgi:hypothetical protein